ncbi:DEAD/DEAH box helicase family protein [Rhodococcoides fascians]|uniref:DEAD/DEAH box helicase family protein n=1 Tax=Rhodococcoides fascians TaxID=1828 RepID=UPI00050CD400|nr:DEAD/DEAH box helicase family protein [Rhodococcus fascians]
MQTAAIGYRLRPHQSLAIEQIGQTWDAGSTRATLVMPCGTGKTVVMHALLEMQSTRPARTVVFVPTVRLLVQTMNVLRSASPRSTLIAVCSANRATTDEIGAAEGPTEEPDLDPRTAVAALDVHGTTDPAELTALLAGSTDTLVVATYASSMAVAAATVASAIVWDLLICDEAHRTAGRADKAWSIPLDNTMIPAHRRLFATATVREVELGLDDPEELGPTEINSMTSVAEYGPIIAPISLRSAISERLLSDYRIATIGVEEAAAFEVLETQAIDNPQLDPAAAAAQLALLRAAESMPTLRSVMVFHNRIDVSRAWASQFRALAREAGKSVRVFHVDGGSDPRHISAALSALAHRSDELVVVSNCRLLAEGIDVPALDAVMFAAPRSSAPDIVQIVGRVLRPHPEGHHNNALIILPVLHRKDMNTNTTTEERVARTRYLTAWQVLTVLAEEDEMIYTSLVEHRRAMDGDAPPPGPDNRVRFDALELPISIGDGFVLEIVRRTTSGWLRVHHLLRQQALHGKTVNPRVGLTVRDSNTSSEYPLGARVEALRRAKSAGRVPKRIIALFDDDPLLAGWSWDKAAGRNSALSVDRKIDLVERYISLTRIPHILPSATVDEPETGRRIKIGAWVANLRPSSLTPTQHARMSALLPDRFRP